MERSFRSAGPGSGEGGGREVEETGLVWSMVWCWKAAAIRAGPTIPDSRSARRLLLQLVCHRARHETCYCIMWARKVGTRLAIACGRPGCLWGMVKIIYLLREKDRAGTA